MAHKSPPDALKDELFAILAPYGQEHLLASWDELDRDERQSLARQIREIDFRLVDRLYRTRDDRGDVGGLMERAEPPPAFRLDTAKNRFTPDQARQCGEQALDDGRLGVILVAGGQGTRLNSDDPKGMFEIGPVSGHSLFQIHVEKIVARAERHGVSIPLYLMTSPATHERTVEFFAEHKRFGLGEEELRIFCQGTMPAVDAATGKVLLERPGRIATSPDGHGGTLAALARSGTLDEIRDRPIKHLFYLQVDNPLVDICRPEFVGYHLLSECEMSSQVIAKREPLEQVGNVVQVRDRLAGRDRLMVAEYSEFNDLPGKIIGRLEPGAAASHFDDLPDELKGKDRPPPLWFWAGSIAVHVIDTAFLERMAERADALPFHLANKTVAYVDSAGRRIEPEEPNAIKFERFIFDLIPWAHNAIVVEVDPARAFAPLKNASGAEKDTPETVKAQMVAVHRDWLRRAGAEVADGVDVEICPLWALDAEEVARKIAPGTRVTEPTYFS